MAGLVQSVVPETYYWYKRTSERFPVKLGGLFACSAINLNSGAIPAHYDESDPVDGICCVVNFGNFATGGVLVFPDLNIQVHARPGDVVAFRSKKLYHGVTDYTNERYSVVLFSSQVCFFDTPTSTGKHKPTGKHKSTSKHKSTGKLKPTGKRKSTSKHKSTGKRKRATWKGKPTGDK